MDIDISSKLFKAINSKEIDSNKLEWAEARLHESQSDSMKQCKNSLLIFTFLSMLWLFIKFSYVNEVSFFGVKLNNTELILLIIPLISALYFYRFVTTFCWWSDIDSILAVLYQKLVPEFSEIDLESYFNSSEFILFELENCLLYDNNDNVSKLRFIWALILSCIIVIIPLIFLFWVSYQLLYFSVFHIYLSKIVGSLVFFLTIMASINFALLIKRQ